MNFIAYHIFIYYEKINAKIKFKIRNKKAT